MANGDGNGNGGTALLNPDEVQVGTANGPGIYAAPAGTTMPDIDGDWETSGWDSLGYLSDDGPTVGQSTDSEDITPWQSVVPIRSVITSRGVTLQFVMWQLGSLQLGMYFDVDPPEEDEGVIDFDIRTDSPQRLHAVAIDARDADRIFRIGFYRASLSAAGDMQIQRGAAIPLDVTLSALDDGGKLARVILASGGIVEQSVSLSHADVAARARAAQTKAAPTRSGAPAAGSGGE
jgi:hypothetical protein